ncbi:MAG: hypothetical protein ACIARR_11565 [Phycisphaerales bacterium JB059]
MRRPMFIAGLLAGAALTGALGAGARSAGEASEQPQARMSQRLIDGLKGTEGCLGVDAAQWQSGKNTICAWFENKAAVERWYRSDTHAGFMGAVGGDPEAREPLRHVADDEGPIMVMATLDFNGPPAIKGSLIPFSMISIELFKPLPGGAYVKDRLAPEKFRVEHMRNLTPEP